MIYNLSWQLWKHQAQPLLLPPPQETSKQQSQIPSTASAPSFAHLSVSWLSTLHSNRLTSPLMSTRLCLLPRSSGTLPLTGLNQILGKETPPILQRSSPATQLSSLH